jgi:hypothetical protein
MPAGLNRDHYKCPYNLRLESCITIRSYICQCKQQQIVISTITRATIELLYGVEKAESAYWLDSRDWIPGRDEIFLFSIASRPALGPSQLPIQ